MHLRPELMKRPRKNRTHLERTFKVFGKLITLLQLGCFVYSIARVEMADSETLTNSMWSVGEPLALNPQIVAQISNASVLHVATIGASSNVTFTVSGDNVSLLMAQLAYELKLMLVVVALAFFFAIINRLWFDFDMYYVTYGQMVLRKDVLSSLDVGFHVSGLVLVSAVPHTANDLRALFDHIGVASSTLPYTTPFTELYVALGVGLGSNLVAALLHCINGVRQEDSDDEDPGDDGPTTAQVTTAPFPDIQRQYYDAAANVELQPGPQDGNAERRRAPRRTPPSPLSPANRGRRHVEPPRTL